MAQVNNKKRKLSKADRGDSDSDYQPEPPKKKIKKNNASKSMSTSKSKSKGKKSKGRGLTKKAVNEYKKKMNGYVRTMAKMVNRDWHDGWQEQGEELQEYFQYLKEPSKTVYQYVIKQRDYEKLNEILKNMADSWSNIHAIPFRCGITDMLEDTVLDFELTEINKTKKFNASPNDLISFMWSLMLYGACGNDEVTDDEIYRYIKDAVDNDVDVLDGCKDDDGENEESENEESKSEESVVDKYECLKRGEDRLIQLLANEEEWGSLATTKKVHKMRRAIDRRFDGELHLRTRDYHLRDDWDEWW